MLSYFPYAPATLAIMIVTSLVSIYALQNELFKDRLLLIPYDTRLDKSYWRLISSGFVHGSSLHLFLNILTLWFFGPLLEYQLGTPWFVCLYFLGLLAGNIGTQLRYQNNSGYPGTLGASGAISGVLLGAIITNPAIKLSLPGLPLIHPSLAVPAWIAAALFLAYTLFFMFRSNDMPKMNHDAHFWGACSGLVLALLVQPDSFGRLMAAM